MISAWEHRILDDLVVNSDEVFVVTKHSSKVVHLWSLMKRHYPDQTIFLSIHEFRDNVFCDCIAERSGTRIPEDAERVYLHTPDIEWKVIPPPADSVSVLTNEGA